MREVVAVGWLVVVVLVFQLLLRCGEGGEMREFVGT
jgi:hypothetical protein